MLQQGEHAPGADAVFPGKTGTLHHHHVLGEFRPQHRLELRAHDRARLFPCGGIAQASGPGLQEDEVGHEVGGGVHEGGADGA